ncbi:hypothetical protein H4R18_003105 [Coemansia javaensis]|uniref:Lysoplasmalogenase n=1 Tax=Coemansia javaensis TaxID=2761396 RepID=A0A9W8HD05_9FUNG|nr:hypothetical protein H4R18_003105 [Coemansia javaensis]
MCAIATGWWQQAKWVLKPAVTLLIAWPTRGGAAPGVFIGQLLSAAGDVCLLFPDDVGFVPGLASFLAAHIAYAASFRAPLRLSWGLAPLAAFAAAMAASLWPAVARDHPLVQGGVALYIAAIVSMTYRASLTRDPTLVAGALLFCVSDSILAWAKFVHPYPWCELGVMSTYYAAQLCIAAAHC